jgi:hypothetical protein
MSSEGMPGGPSGKNPEKEEEEDTRPKEVTYFVGSKTIVAKPDHYDGNPDTYITWRRRMRTYLRGNRTEIRSNYDAALCILSHLTKGRARNFGDVMTVQLDLIDPEGFDKLYSYESYWEKIDAYFESKTKKADAYLKLQNLSQGSMTAQDYFLEFDSLAQLAGYENVLFDEMKILLAESKLNRGLVRSIYLTKDIPTTWEKFKDVATILDANFRTLQARLKGPDSRDRGSLASRLGPRPAYSAGAKPSVLVRDPNAMDVDATRLAQVNTSAPARQERPPIRFDPENPNRVIGSRIDLARAGACFYCKERGHMKAQCPLLAEGAPRRGGFTPLVRPNAGKARSLDTKTNYTSTERITSPVPSYAASTSTATIAPLDDNDSDFLRD